jgi:uncharacterized protein YndB with AHSA1/START domain
MSNDSIEKDIWIAAPVERVWSLVTEAEHLGTWFGDAGAEVDLRPGGALVLRWAKHGNAHGVVEEVEPPTRLLWRWARKPEELPRAGNSTVVEFTLEPERDGTRFRVVETGFASLDASEAERLEAFEGNTEGWGIELGHLKEYAE